MAPPPRIITRRRARRTLPINSSSSNSSSKSPTGSSHIRYCILIAFVAAFILLRPVLYEALHLIDNTQQPSRDVGVIHHNIAADHPASVQNNNEDRIDLGKTNTGNNGFTTDTNFMLPMVLHFPAYLDDGIEMFMELDGLKGSKALHLLDDANTSMLCPNVTWIGSPIIRQLCNIHLAERAIAFYRQEHPGEIIKTDWTFHLLDWSDDSVNLIRCHALENMVGRDRVHYWKRSIVAGRRWNATT